MSTPSKGIRSSVGAAATRFLSNAFGPPEHVLAFVPVPEKPKWVPDGVKVDYLYWLTLLKRLQNDFGQRPLNFLEIGANCAQDAWFISRQLGLEPACVAVVEPVHANAQIIRHNTQFQLFECAVSDGASQAHLWVPKEDGGLCGMASLGERAVGDAAAFREVAVACMSGQEIVDQLGWAHIDLLKVDVEGFSAQVLRSFGHTLSQVRTIQVETERVKLWEGQETESEVFTILCENGFTMVDYQLAYDAVQADSVWVNSSDLVARVFDRQRNEWQDLAPEEGP